MIIRPFAWVFNTLFEFTGSYGIALILFAVLAKLILLYPQIRGKKSMMRMSSVNPKLQQLQKQYGKDKMRYNEEIQKLYKEENISPFGGCLWTIVPLPIMLILYTVIRKPMTYIMDLSGQQIYDVAVLAEAHGFTLPNNFSLDNVDKVDQLSLVRYAMDYLQEFSAKVEQLVSIDFTFLGLDLSQIPHWKFWEGEFSWAYIGVFLIPFISGTTAFFSSRIMMKTNNPSGTSGNAQADRMSKQMVYMMPLMSIWIGFVLPAGLGIYWITNNVLSLVQELLVGRKLKAKFEEEEARRQELRRLEAEREKQLRAERIAQREAEAKKNKGKKKSPAAPKKKKTQEPTTERGRVGNRPYARGRAYDPDRYGEEGYPAAEEGEDTLTLQEAPEEILSEQAPQESEEVWESEDGGEFEDEEAGEDDEDEEKRI